MHRAIARRAALVGGFAFLLWLVGMPPATAGGGLDPSFGTDGIVTTAFPIGAYASGVAIQPDGKIVAAGAAAGATGRGEFAVARYLRNGKLDPTFDGDGMVTTPIAGGGDAAMSVAVQPNGRIVAAGTDSWQRVALVRYRPNGRLDRSFGGNGIVRTNLKPGEDVAYDLAIQPNGRLVVVGYAGSSPPRFAVLRYRTDGTLDPTFGDRGRFIAPGGFGVARSVVLQPDGRIVVAGYNGHGVVIARFRTNGHLDPSFGGDGWVGKIAPPVFALAVAIQPNGRIVAAGDHDIFDVGMVRVTRGGRLDTSFGHRGVVRVDVGPGEQALSAVMIRRDGRIVAAGYAGPHEFGDAVQFRFVSVRCLRDGSLDRTWGGNGKVVTRFPGEGMGRDAVAQANGRIVMVGGAGESHGDAFVLTRYLP
jgi:uncharacterized delta-60 repeat protein